MIFRFLRQKHAAFGLAGAALVALGALAAALAYTGPDGESYSLLNHFISELGELGVSPLAWLFNLGLIAGGLLFVPFSLGLGLSLAGWLPKVSMLAGQVTVVLFGLAILFQPKEQVVIDKRANLASLIAAACYASFILYSSITPMPDGTNALAASFRTNRPAVWPLAVLEWSIFFSTILWFAAIALAGRRAQNRSYSPLRHEATKGIS